MGLQNVELSVRKRHLVGANQIVGSLVFNDRTVRVLDLLLQLFYALLHNLTGDNRRFLLLGKTIVDVSVDNRVNNRCRLHGVLRRKSYRYDTRHLLSS